MQRIASPHGLGCTYCLAHDAPSRAEQGRVGNAQPTQPADAQGHAAAQGRAGVRGRARIWRSSCDTKTEDSMATLVISKPCRRTGTPSNVARSRPQDSAPMRLAQRGRDSWSPRKLPRAAGGH